MKVKDFDILPMSKEESDIKLREMMKEKVDNISNILSMKVLNSENIWELTLKYESLFLDCYHMIYGLKAVLNKMEEIEKKTVYKHESRSRIN